MNFKVLQYFVSIFFRLEGFIIEEKSCWDHKLPRMWVQSKLKNSFVYEYEMSTCGINSKNSHL